MVSADVSVTVQVQASRLRQWLFIPFCWILGEQHPLVAQIWDALKPLRIKVDRRAWETVKWDDFLRWTEEEGE